MRILRSKGRTSITLSALTALVVACGSSNSPAGGGSSGTGASGTGNAGASGTGPGGGNGTGGTRGSGGGGASGAANGGSKGAGTGGATGSGGGGASGTAAAGGTSGTGAGGTSGDGGAGDGGASCGSPGSFNCDYKAAGTEVCYTYEGLTASQLSAEKTACMAETGATTPACCPTAGKSGCCENVPLSGSSITYGYCYYNVPAADLSALKSSCTSLKGTWSM